MGRALLFVAGSLIAYVGVSSHLHFVVFPEQRAQGIFEGPVRVAACQALGRLRAAEAAEPLRRVARESHPALKRAAQHALEQIRENRDVGPDTLDQS